MPETIQQRVLRLENQLKIARNGLHKVIRAHASAKTILALKALESIDRLNTPAPAPALVPVPAKEK